MAGVEIDGADVVRLILQFLKENDLHRSFHVLHTETDVALNSVDSLDAFTADVLAGRWPSVIKQVRQLLHVLTNCHLRESGYRTDEEGLRGWLDQVGMLKLPPEKLMDLYEQIIKEMMELHEWDTAHSLLRGTIAMRLMKHEQPTRCVFLSSAPRCDSRFPRPLTSFLFAIVAGTLDWSIC